MTTIVIVPTCRLDNWPAVVDNIQKARAKADVRLMFVLYRHEYVDEKINAAVMPHMREWINIYPTHEETGWLPALFKINMGIDLLEQHMVGNKENTWLMFGADDDLVPFSIGEAVDKHADANARVIVTSCKRGQRAVMTGYPTWPLIAEPGNMVPCAVTGSQAIVRLDALEGLRFRNHAQADGELIQKLHQKMPDAFRYLRHYYIPFNSLEPQRWDQSALDEVLNQPCP